MSATKRLYCSFRGNDVTGIIRRKRDPANEFKFSPIFATLFARIDVVSRASAIYEIPRIPSSDAQLSLIE